MKKVSCRKLLSAIGKGMQWFFGLFGFGHKWKPAKVLWAIFAVSAAACISVLTIQLVWGVAHSLVFDYHYEQQQIRKGGRYVSDAIGYATDFNREHGFIFDKRTGKKLLKGIEWIALPRGNDSLVCYSDGKLRGYFNANDGKVVIKPKYRHAWVFSDGVAAVEEDGYIRFIDETGKVVLDKGMIYDSRRHGYVFSNGYLMAASKESGLYGLMDKLGNWAIPAEYNTIEASYDNAFWCLCKGDSSAVYDKELNKVIPFIAGRIIFSDQTINAILADHTIRKYDYKGNIISNFCVFDVIPLDYKSDWSYYEDEDMIEKSEYVIKDCARLRYYVAGDNYKGLITEEGRIMTMPIYKEIKAIGPDTYLCDVGDGCLVVVNGNGERVR